MGPISAVDARHFSPVDLPEHFLIVAGLLVRTSPIPAFGSYSEFVPRTEGFRHGNELPQPLLVLGRRTKVSIALGRQAGAHSIARIVLQNCHLRPVSDCEQALGIVRASFTEWLSRRSVGPIEYCSDCPSPAEASAMGLALLLEG